MTEDNRKGLKTSNHPDKCIIERMLLTGWSPLKIERYLKEKYPDDSSKWVSEHTLLDYRKNFMALRANLPVSYYEQKLKQLDVTIDTLQELYSSIEIQKRRVSYNLEIEDKNKVSLPDTRKEMEVLFTMLAKSLELEMRLGIRKEAPTQLDVRSFDMASMLDAFINGRKERINVTPTTLPESQSS